MGYYRRSGRCQPTQTSLQINIACTVDDTYISPEASLALRNHSPTGHAWGYLGSGPSQTSPLIVAGRGRAVRRSHAALSLFERGPGGATALARPRYGSQRGPRPRAGRSARNPAPPSLYVASQVIREWYQAHLPSRPSMTTQRFAVVFPAHNGTPALQLFYFAPHEADVRRRLEKRGLLDLVQEIRPAPLEGQQEERGLT